MMDNQKFFKSIAAQVGASYYHYKSCKTEDIHPEAMVERANWISIQNNLYIGQARVRVKGWGLRV